MPLIPRKKDKGSVKQIRDEDFEAKIPVKTNDKGKQGKKKEIQIIEKEPEFEEKGIRIDDNIIRTNDIITTEEDIITTDEKSLNKKAVKKVDQKPVHVDNPNKPNRLKNILSVQNTKTYKALNNALEQVYEYLTKPEVYEIADRYRELQLDLQECDQKGSAGREQILDDIRKIKEQTAFKKYQLALSTRDRLSEQLERYVESKERCDEINAASLQVKQMRNAQQYDPYTGSQLQQETKLRVLGYKKIEEPEAQNEFLEINPQAGNNDKKVTTKKDTTKKVTTKKPTGMKKK